MQIDSENIPKNENFDPRTATSEAEVRLVVRFIVEEHIVYKGKVERVQQLESEELSRVVSRVAWDGARESENLKSNDNGKAQETNVQEQNQQDQTTKNYCKQIDTIDEPVLTPQIDIPDPADKSPDHVQKTTASNTDTSDHIAYVKSSPAPEEIEVTEKVEASKDENSVAQDETPQTVESKTTNDCDITTEIHPSNNNNNNQNQIDCEHEQNECSQNLPSIQESENRRTSITSKEQRNLNSRTSANKTVVDNAATKQNANLSTRSINMSLLANNQQNMRQNKLFAKWTDNHFYPGTILKQAKDRKFVVGFLDGAQKIVAETDLIPLSNIEGKQVRVSIAKNYCVNAIVHNQRTPVNDQPMFDVEYQQDGLVKKCVPLKDIFLTGDQGTPLINQVDRNSGASNFADVDLDNIIYEKRSRRLQDMEDYELTENSATTGKRRRGQHSSRHTPRAKNSSGTTNLDCSANNQALGQKRHSQNDIKQQQQPQQQQPQQQQQQPDVVVESFDSPDVLKTNFLCPNSNPPSEGSSSTGSSNVPNVLELGQEFYFTSSSPHRTKTSLLL